MRRASALLATCAVAAMTAGAAGSATSATTYSRLSAHAIFTYSIDYGSHPDSVFNGKYTYWLSWRVRTIVAFDGNRATSLSGLMLADGRVTLEQDLTQWRGPETRVPVRCKTPGSVGGGGQEYVRDTEGGRFSGGGGVGVSNSGLTVNPGRAVNWSIECSATESLAFHGLQDGPGFRVPPPPKANFRGSKAFSIACRDLYKHEWDPSRDIPNAHTFVGQTKFIATLTPFPADQLTATKKRLRDAGGKPLTSGPEPKTKDCP